MSEERAEEMFRRIPIVWVKEIPGGVSTPVYSLPVQTVHGHFDRDKSGKLVIVMESGDESEDQRPR